MLKKIRVDQLQLGMHLHELCGAWLDHPFWKSSFLVRDPQDLVKLRASGVSECWIDTAKGADVTVPGTGAAHASPTGAPERAAAPASIEVAAPVRTSFNDESRHAEMLCAKAKQTITSLFDRVRMGRAFDSGDCVPLVDEIVASVQRNSSALIGLVRLKTRDDYTHMHSVAVCALMVALARRMGQDELQIRDAGLGGLLHDIGKAKIPLDVLNKPGSLTDAEYELMKHHPRYGHALLLEDGSVGPVAREVCLRHHERPDGRGYPDGLHGYALSLQARMGAVCEVYDAITSNRPYEGAWQPADAIAKMAEWTKAGQFDPMVFRAFVECVGIYPVGSLVRLQSQRLAVVIQQNEASPVSPWVRVFYSTRSKMPVAVETVDLGQAGSRDRIIGRESNDEWGFPFLDALSVGSQAR